LTEILLIGIATLMVVGVGSQWLAWRFGVPSILLLLVFGFIIGPVTGFFNPDAFLGDLLLPVVSVSVAIILFEGGLSLRISELKGYGAVVRNLVTIGVAVTWVVGSFAAYYLAGIDLSISVLLGAVLVVTGPTVIIPLLRHVRPVGYLASILRWEGIVIDPIGATLAVLVFEVILAGGVAEASSAAAVAVFQTIAIGVVAGGLGAWILIALLKRYWIPDFLQNPFTLMMVIGIFALSDHFQSESGLLSVTIMGMVLANQKTVAVKHIAEFKENLRVLLIGSLFILLAARLRLSDFSHLHWGSLAFLAALIVIARPLAVLLSTIGSGLKFKERFFLMCMAPRGIVAAAIASVFALKLMEQGYAQAEIMVPVVFMVIIGTVALYGLGSAPVAALLGIARPNPQGIMFIGAHLWARAVAKVLQDSGIEVLLTDNNWANISQARMAGLPAHYGNVLSDSLPNKLDLGGLGRLIALTPNDNVNSLSAMQFSDEFESERLYQLPPEDEKRASEKMRGRSIFGEGVNFSYIDTRFRAGMVIKKTKLTEEFHYDAFKARYGGAVPMFVINENKEITVFTIEPPLIPKPGDTIISLLRPIEEEVEERQAKKQAKKQLKAKGE
jgi:NhaP-type Na+/H+ or K+/H+ antiporter